MAIPDYKSFFLKFLMFVSDKKEHSLRETINHLIEEFGFTEEEQKEILPSGNQTIIDNRIGWARTYLKKAGLLEYTRRGYFKITDRGLDLLRTNPNEISIKMLLQYEEFREFKKGTSSNNEVKTGKQDELTCEEESTPDEIIEKASQNLRKILATDLLEQVKTNTPEFFEKLVVELLLKMGYGGSRKDAGEATRLAKDGGIDGIIKEDKLGLDLIYLQAKRWEGTVGAPEIQKFAGALQGNRAKKGVFITTSSFSKEAREFVKNIDSKIILIDGEYLTELMIDHNLGVSIENTYEIKKIDSDYFEED
ncbi:MAG: restriction endonuclease [Vampirovibrionia bacterium]